MATSSRNRNTRLCELFAPKAILFQYLHNLAIDFLVFQVFESQDPSLCHPVSYSVMRFNQYGCNSLQLLLIEDCWYVWSRYSYMRNFTRYYIPHVHLTNMQLIIFTFIRTKMKNHKRHSPQQPGTTHTKTHVTVYETVFINSNMCLDVVS